MKDNPIVLVVDDQPQNIELLEAYLAPQGYEIVTAANGEEALGKLSGNSIDMILLDVMMPGMDGFEVTRRVRQDSTHRLLPIILVTALRETEDRVKGIEAGCDDFISKPVDKMELLARVRSLLKVKAYNDLMSNYQKELESEVTRRTKEKDELVSKLEKSEAFLKATGQMAKVGGWDLDAANLDVIWTEETYRIYELPLDHKPALEEVINCFHPDERQKLSDSIRRALKWGEPFDIEMRFISTKGKHLWTRAICFPQVGNGKIVRLRGTLQDITERKRAEEALRESEERYKALFDRSLDLVYINDFEGHFIDANAAALNRLGYTREEIRSLNFASLLSEDQIPLAFKILQEIRETSIQKDLIELKLWHKDGTHVYVETQGSTVMSNGKPVAILQNARDITDRKRAEETLSQTLEHLRKAVGGIIQVISSTVESRDPYTAGHQRRVADLARAMAGEMDLNDDQMEGLAMAGTIHDLGKVSIPAEILSKPTKLTEIEYQLIQAHSQIGYDILKGIEFPWPIADMILQHHERMNGSGYPQGLKGEDILLEARILMVADVVEAMASHRPYRPALGIDAALEEIEKNKGILYDPEVTEMCLWLFREKGFRFE
jgi:PAS domain S-box-containing protein